MSRADQIFYQQIEALWLLGQGGDVYAQMALLPYRLHNVR